MGILDSTLYGPKDGNRYWKVSTYPSDEPVTLAELKTFARIDGTDEDTYLTSLIVAVREAVENYIGRALITQTIELYFDFWPSLNIELPRPPLQSITNVYTLDEANASTVYASTNYYVISAADPGQLVIKNGVAAPTNSDRYYGGYRVTFVAGYGDDPEDVPGQIKEAIMLWATVVYETRAMSATPPPDAKMLLDQYKVIKY